MGIKKIEAKAYQLLETKKWVPSGLVFDPSGGHVNIQEFDLASEGYFFDTKEEADIFFSSYLMNI